MSGAVIENLSNRKLCAILVTMAVALVGFFLIGGIVSECVNDCRTSQARPPPPTCNT